MNERDAKIKALVDRRESIKSALKTFNRITVNNPNFMDVHNELIANTRKELQHILAMIEEQSFLLGLMAPRNLYEKIKTNIVMDCDEQQSVIVQEVIITNGGGWAHHRKEFLDIGKVAIAISGGGNMFCSTDPNLYGFEKVNAQSFIDARGEI